MILVGSRMKKELEKVGIGKIEVKQLDPIEPEIHKYEGESCKLLMFKGEIYKSDGFQILEQGDNTMIVRETYYKRFNR